MVLDPSLFKREEAILLKLFKKGDLVYEPFKMFEIEKVKKLDAELRAFKEQLIVENKEIQGLEKRGETVSAERKKKWLQNYRNYKTCRTSVNFMITALKASILNTKILHQRIRFRDYNMEEQLMYLLRKDVLKDPDEQKIDEQKIDEQKIDELKTILGKWKKKITKLEDRITKTNDDLPKHRKRIDSLNISTPEGLKTYLEQKTTLQQITDIHNLSCDAHGRMKQAIRTKETMIRLYEENKERKQGKKAQESKRRQEPRRR